MYIFTYILNSMKQISLTYYYFEQDSTYDVTQYPELKEVFL